MFLIFPRKQDVSFHANCLHWRKLAWNVTASFLWQIRKNIPIRRRPKILPRVLNVNRLCICGLQILRLICTVDNFFFFFFVSNIKKHHIYTKYSRTNTSQWAHNVKMTSYQRRCDVITSHRRWYDVILMLCACWAGTSLGPWKFLRVWVTVG